MVKPKQLSKTDNSNLLSPSRNSGRNNTDNHELTSNTNPVPNKTLSTKSYFDTREDVPKKMTLSKLLWMTTLFCSLAVLIKGQIDVFNPKEYLNPCSFNGILPAYKIRDFKDDMNKVKKEMVKLKAEHDTTLAYPASTQEKLTDFTATLDNLNIQHNYQKENRLICYRSNIISKFLIKPWTFFAAYLLIIISLYSLYAYYWYQAQQMDLTDNHMPWKTATMLGISFSVLIMLLYRMICDLRVSKYVDQFPY